MPFSTVISVKSLWPVHLSVLSWFFLTITPNNILPKLLPTLPHNHRRNNGQQWKRNESSLNDYHQSSARILAKPGDLKKKKSSIHIKYLYGSTCWCLVTHYQMKIFYTCQNWKHFVENDIILLKNLNLFLERKKTMLVHIFLFHQYFQKPSSEWLSKFGIMR